MDAGDYPHRITIQAAASSRGASGQEVLSWASPTTVGSRWARIEFTGSSTRLRNLQISPEAELVISLASGRLAVTTKHRVSHSDGRVWDIVGIETMDGKAPANSDEIVLQVKAGIRQGS